jgi:type II secretory pathway pseudopilin PulG
MNFFPQPCLALPDSPKLKAKQGHAKYRHGSFLSHPSCGLSGQSQDSRVLKFHHLKSKIQKLKFGGSAFSLTEVVIAMGVAAVAFTSIIALFPLGLSMSKESYETTQAAFITQSIMNQITDAQGGNTLTGFRRIIKTADNDPTKGGLESINVGKYSPSTNVYITYTNYVNTNGEVSWKPASTITADVWKSGKLNSPALVRVTLNRIFTGGTKYDIHGVEVQVDYPGNLALTNLARKHEIFSRICH